MGTGNYRDEKLPPQTAAAGLIPVFVYGTLKPGEAAFSTHCTEARIQRSTAWVEGRLYHLPQGYPALTLEAGWVQGALLQLPPTVLKHLDNYEDFAPHCPHHSAYLRLLLPVHNAPTQEMLTLAWAYVMAQAQVRQAGGHRLRNGLWTGDRSGISSLTDLNCCENPSPMAE